MYTILAPSKTLELSASLPSWVESTRPIFSVQAKEIHEQLLGMAEMDVTKLMKISASKSEEVQRYLQSWKSTPSRSAVYTYRGDVYKGFYVDTLDEAAMLWAQRHIGIMSGLYGILRPLDDMSPYRLEMGLKLPVGKAKNLYEYWGDKLARYVDSQADGTICVLSSEEYAKPVTKLSQSRIIIPVFMDHKPNGTVGQVPIYSKMMRGVMARWIIDNRIDDAIGLKEFTGFDYKYDKDRSSSDRPVFVRSTMKPLVF